MTRAETAGTETRTAKADAVAFLQAALAGDPVPASQVSRMAREHGLTPKAIRMGREALGVEIERNGFGPGGRSLWSLPGGHIDAQPTLPEEGVSASREESNVSEKLQPNPEAPAWPAIAGYRVIEIEPDDPCDYCGERGDAPVFWMTGTYRGGRHEPLHEVCAGRLREFYGRINERDGQA
jgi:hypothetical protein